MSDGVAAYPLAWPAGRPRTPPSQRRVAKFRSQSDATYYRLTKAVAVTVEDARKRLADELDRLGASYIVLSTNLELRLDGQPRSRQAEPEDPGAVLYFRLRDGPIVLACDRWNSVAGNIAAIAAHIEALRGQDRWGVGTIEQAFAGFAALPPPIMVDDWRAVLGNPASLAEAEATYRDRIKSAHPDAGGSHASAAALNAAIAEARMVLSDG